MNGSRRMLLALVVMMGSPQLVAAQQTDQAPRQVRRSVELAFMAQMRRQLGLDDAQATRVQEVLVDWGSRRRALEVEERALTAALHGQLRPGVAAQADSVNWLIDRLLANRVEHAESFQGEMRDLGPILSPAQRGQFLGMRDQIFRRIQEMQNARPLQGRPVQQPRQRP